jgi:hypothetical protein
MMLTLFLIVCALAVLILVLWIVQAGPGRSFDANHRLREIDIPAFRNLLSRDDEQFLRRSLTSAHYRRVRRARLRAEQEYLAWIAENCAVLLSLLRSGDEKSSAEQPLDIAALAKDALRLRLIAVGLWFLLWIEYLVPNLQIRPLHTIRKYEELWRTVEIHLDAIMPHSTVVAEHGRA